MASKLLLLASPLVLKYTLDSQELVIYEVKAKANIAGTDVKGLHGTVNLS